MTRDEIIARAKAKGMDDDTAGKAADAYLDREQGGNKSEPVAEKKGKPAAPVAKPAPKKDEPAKVAVLEDYRDPAFKPGDGRTPPAPASARHHTTPVVAEPATPTVPRGVAGSYGRAERKMADDEAVQARDFAGETREKMRSPAASAAYAKLKAAGYDDADSFKDDELVQAASRL